MEPPTDPNAKVQGPLPALATGLAIWSAVAIVIGLVLTFQSGQSFREAVDQHTLIAAVVALSFSVVGAFVVQRQPRHGLAWVLIAVGQFEALATFLAAYGLRPELPGAPAAELVGQLIWMPGQALAGGLITTLFPDGRPPSRRWRFLVWIPLGATAAILLLMPFADPGPPAPHNPLALPEPYQAWLPQVAFGLIGLCFACGLVGLVLLIIRIVRTSGAERHRLLWFFVAFLPPFLCQLAQLDPLIITLGYVWFAIGLGIAMIRHRLFDGDRLLGRTIVFGVVTVVIAAALGLTVGLASALLGGPTSGAVVAAVVIALGLLPLYRVVQRNVERLLYGNERDPYVVITELGDRLSGVGEPEATLTTVTETIARSLRLPYAAITLAGEIEPAATYGGGSEHRLAIPLVHGGAEVGTLAVGLPGGRRFLDPRDDRLLRDLAQQMAGVADRVRLTRELRRSRDQLAETREQERDRLRRDLHDGLGPTLAGVSLGIGAVRRGAGPEQLPLLGRLQQEMDDAVEEVRRLVDDLRPGGLDGTDLVAALTAYAADVTTRTAGRPIITVATENLPPLAPELEAAAYRIIGEAVTNVVRHARADTAHVRLTADERDLTIEVCDDGIGLAAAAMTGSAGGGLGLSSMAHRAAALGGSCVTAELSTGGTRIAVRLPLERVS